MKTKKRCLIIGAGISGLMAALKLDKNGVDVTVIDKASGVGGRMATRHMEGYVFDHGAQFFTARSDGFKTYVNEWLEKGIIRTWGEAGSFTPEAGMSDDERVFVGTGGMTAVSKYLARELKVELLRRAVEINYLTDHWEVTTENHEIFQSEALMITAPLPQSLELMRSGNLSGLNGRHIELERIRYNSCITLLVIYDGVIDLPSPGLLDLSGEPLARITDNRAKGISAGASALTIHTGSAFSRKYWEQDDEMLAKNILYVASGWLKSAYTSYQLKRWRYSRPVNTYRQLCFVLSDRMPLVLAGDGFGGPRIEDAAMSGLAGAGAILRLLREKKNNK